MNYVSVVHYYTSLKEPQKQTKRAEKSLSQIQRKDEGIKENIESELGCRGREQARMRVAKKS